jgi:uncharacterized protein HemY
MRSVDLAPENGLFWNTLGIAQYRNGDWNSTIATLTKSIELRKENDASDLFFLAMAHWQLHEKEKARAWYAQAIAWMDQHNSQDEEFKRFRDEATGLLGVAEAEDAQKKKD